MKLVDCDRCRAIVPAEQAFDIAISKHEKDAPIFDGYAMKAEICNVCADQIKKHYEAKAEAMRQKQEIECNIEKSIEHGRWISKY